MGNMCSNCVGFMLMYGKPERHCGTHTIIIINDVKNKNKREYIWSCHLLLNHSGCLVCKFRICCFYSVQYRFLRRQVILMCYFISFVRISQFFCDLQVKGFSIVQC